MKLDENKFALRSGIVVGFIYLVCAGFTALWPEVAIKSLGWMTHLVNIEQFAIVNITWGGAILGLIQALVYSYLIARVFAWIFNKSLRA